MATTSEVTYPFLPKTTATLEAGQFWDIPLSNGGYAAGVVLIPKAYESGRGSTTTFVAGLLAWSGPQAPTPEELAGRRICTWGKASVRAIAASGGELLGKVDKTAGGILMVDARAGAGVRRFLNGIDMGPATPRDLQKLEVCSWWGMGVPAVLAERTFVRGLPLIAKIGSPYEHTVRSTFVTAKGGIKVKNSKIK
jgi:hypothetical protein